MIWLTLLACSKGPGTEETDAPTPTGEETAETGDDFTGMTGDSDPYDCANPPPVPYTFTSLQNFGDAEDFDFDMLGNHVSVGLDGNLVGRDINGSTSLIAPNVANGTACTRMLPDGNFVVCDVAANSLLKVDTTTGQKTTLLSGLSYPNGAEVDLDGFIYVAEQSGGRVLRVNSDTGEATLIANGLAAPNGVIFSPDYQTLYVGSFGAGRVWAIDRTGPDTFEDPRVLVVQQGSTGGFDGINVDICGNVYITEFTTGRVARVSPDGTQVDLAVTLPSFWIPNVRWGTGRDGWSDTTMYVSDRSQGRLFAIDVGIPGKPAFLPPAP